MISADTVAGLLRSEGFSLQANAKVLEGVRHPDRDERFRYINSQAEEHQRAGQPVVSIDAKKKELVGVFKNPGRSWEPAGRPVPVGCHDFPGAALGRALPYGVYDLTANTGWVNVGCDHDTAAFAVESLRRWWNGAGRAASPAATRLPVTCDAGGSNGHRTRLWKTQLSALAGETGTDTTVCHFPPGTGKWNKVEHRLFSHITMNWRGRPLTSHEVVVQSIAATTTRTGLSVHAELDLGIYPTGIQVDDDALATIAMTRHRFHGDWNYTAHPAPACATEPAALRRAPQILPWADLTHPDLTGLARSALAAMMELLTPVLEQERVRARYERRGRRERLAPGPDPAAKAKLTPGERIVTTVLYQRKLAGQDLLAELFAVEAMTISRTVREVGPLLKTHGYEITASTARFRTPADITEYLSIQPHEIKPTC